jgi:hypothetical protein
MGKLNTPRRLMPSVRVGAMRPISSGGTGFAIWTIPAEPSKNGKEHKVPLSPLAIQTQWPPIVALVQDLGGVPTGTDAVFDAAQRPARDQDLTGPRHRRRRRRHAILASTCCHSYPS